ncbi:MAG: hypothetical protein ABUL66_00265 [Verrucomicrobiota bacterium]
MKTPVRFSLGIILGALCGGVIVALLLFKLPSAHERIGAFAMTFRIVFGRFFEKHAIFILTSVGAIIGAAIGVSLAVSKRCFGVVMTFICGIVIGGAVVFFIGGKVAEWSVGAAEQSAANREAFAYLQGLKAIDRGKTNQLYLAHFQENSRIFLTNYLREVEGWKAAIFFDANTNLPSYKTAKKYLATHTNDLSPGDGF